MLQPEHRRCVEDEGCQLACSEGADRKASGCLSACHVHTESDRERARQRGRERDLTFYPLSSPFAFFLCCCPSLIIPFPVLLIPLFFCSLTFLCTCSLSLIPLFLFLALILFCVFFFPFLFQASILFFVFLSLSLFLTHLFITFSCSFSFSFHFHFFFLYYSPFLSPPPVSLSHLFSLSCFCCPSLSFLFTFGLFLFFCLSYRALFSLFLSFPVSCFRSLSPICLSVSVPLSLSPKHPQEM